MATPNTSVQRAFLKGLQKIYKELFQYVYVRFMDHSRTVVDDVYGETHRKAYLKPIKMLGHFRRERSKDTDPVKSESETVTIKIPIHEFIDNGIEFTKQEDLEMLKQAVILFNGEAYQVDEVNPYSVVAGQYLMCTFDCQKAEDYVPDEYDRFFGSVIDNA